MGGYNHCGCRDCFGIIVGEPGELCDDCAKAGCEPNEECRNPHSYGGVDGAGHCGDTECCGEFEPLDYTELSR